MKHCILFLWAWLALVAGAEAQHAPATEADTVTHEVVMETTAGNLRIVLSNATPVHRDNFLRLVRQGYYDGLLFHRVIPLFMVQAGDSASRHAAPGQLLGNSPDSCTLPAEIRFPALLHQYGAVAAAREADEVNPSRESSPTQFYIVTGQVFDDASLDKVQTRLDEQTHGAVKLTREVREVYKTIGGSPHLDGQYTVFGQVVEGMDAVETIQWADRDENNRPVDDVRILRARVVR